MNMLHNADFNVVLSSIFMVKSFKMKTDALLAFLGEYTITLAIECPPFYNSHGLWFLCITTAALFRYFIKHTEKVEE